MKVTPIEEVSYGTYLWEMPSGAIVMDDEGNYMCIFAIKGDVKKIKQLKDFAKSHGIEGGYRLIKKARWGDLWYFEKRIPHKFRKETKFGKRLW